MATDFRSDTVTRPTPAMRAAMAAAAGRRRRASATTPPSTRSKPRSPSCSASRPRVFVPSGTQSNLVGVMTHCARGDEYIVGQEAHTYRYEAGGAAVLGSVQPQPLDNAADGTIPLPDIEAAIKPDDAHFARTRLIALENTIGGRVLPAGYAAAVRELADRARARDAPRRRAAVECRGEAGRAAAGDRAGLRFGLGVPVEGTRRAGRLGALRRPRFHQGRAALAQDAGRRHAAGRDHRGGRALRASRTTSRGSPRTTRTRRGSPRGSRSTRSSRWRPRRRTWSSSACRRPSPRRSPRTSRRTACGPTARRGSAGARISTSRARTSTLRSPASTGSSRGGADGGLDGATRRSRGIDRAQRAGPCKP